MKLNTDLGLKTSLRMSGAIPLLHLHAFMVRAEMAVPSLTAVRTQIVKVMVQHDRRIRNV